MPAPRKFNDEMRERGASMEHDPGAYLTGLLSPVPVRARGVLGDGQSWVLRWETGGRPVALAVESAAGGQALSRLARPTTPGGDGLDVLDRGLSARWMSTSASSREGAVAVVAGGDVAAVTMTSRTGQATAGEPLFRDPESGEAVFVFRGVAAADSRVEGLARRGITVADVELSGPTGVEAARHQPVPEVPAALGGAFVVAALLVAVVAVLVAVALGPSQLARGAVLGACHDNRVSSGRTKIDCRGHGGREGRLRERQRS